MFKRFISISIILLSITSTVAQTTAEDKLGSWYILATNNKVSDNLSIQAQTQFRFYEVASELEQFKIRAGATYKFTKALSVSAGYAYFRTDPSYTSNQPLEFNEHRLYEDISLSNSFGKLGIKHRYRIEHRFFDFEDGNDTRHWMRYMLKLSYPVTEQISVDLYDEIFINLQTPLFGQNWLGGGVSYKLNDLLKLRAGYQRISLEGAGFDRLQLGIYINTDLRNKETQTSTP